MSRKILSHCALAALLSLSAPLTLAGEDDAPNLIGLESQLVPGYPATPAGQARNLRDVLSIVRAVPNGRGLGAFYWDATWTAVPGNGWNPADPTTPGWCPAGALRKNCSKGNGPSSNG